jgi:hypothetical protein
MDKIDRTLNNKTDFFTNRRKADPVAKQLAYSLDNVKMIQEFGANIFPPNLIFFDESLKKEQIEEFIAKFKGLNKTTDLMQMRKVIVYLYSSLMK